MFEYNEWSSPLLIGFVQGVAFAAILLIRGIREERISDFLAASLLVFGSLYVGQWMLGFAGWYDAHDWRTTIMFYVEWKNLLAFGPLIWLYFLSLTNTDFRWGKVYWLHFLPLALVWLEPLGVFLYDWIYWKGFAGHEFTYFHGTRGPAAEWNNSNGLGFWFYVLVTVFSFIHLGYYLVRTILAYREYRRYLLEEFSNAEQLTFGSLRFTLYLMLIGVVATFLLEIGNQLFSETYVDSWDSYFAMSLFNFFVAIQFLAINPRLTRALRFQPGTASLSMPSPTSHIPTRLSSGAPPQSTSGSITDGTTDPELSRWVKKLDKRLGSHDDFLNPDLKLGDLAEYLGTNSSVLSKVINSHYGKNFNDFINGLRCEAFRKRLRSGEHHRHTLLSIALDCGFNSKSTFNRAFKKHTGISPGEAVKNLEAVVA